MFALAPVAMMLEDLSGARRLFDEWHRQGITDIRAYLKTHPECVRQCLATVRVIKVNRRTLSLYEATSIDHLMDNMSLVFRNKTPEELGEEFAMLWEGQTHISNLTANSTLTGRHLDLQLTVDILPGHEQDWARALVALEDVTERENARRSQGRSEAYARDLFEHSPISLWVEDLSAVKQAIDELRESGVVDFPAYLTIHPAFIDRCMRSIRVRDVNSYTLSMFRAPDKETLFARLNDIFRDDMREGFAKVLIDFWDGKLYRQQECINYALDGTALDIHLQSSVFPGHESTFDLVLVALTDISARKRAEKHFEFLSTHDVLTRLFNRAFYAKEMARLERSVGEPLTIVVADLNGLKLINDRLGHRAGDEMLRRVGDILADLVAAPAFAARIGGDEFVVVLPGGTQADAQLMIRRILEATSRDDLGSADSLPLSLSLGAATRRPGEHLESVFSRADARMYAHKQAYYAGRISEAHARPQLIATSLTA